MPFGINLSLSYLFKEAGQISPASIITSFILAISSFFYIFSLGSYMKVTVYELVHRYVYETSFQKYVISRDVDHAIIAAALLVWILMSVHGKTRLVVSIAYGLAIVVAMLLSLETVLELAALLSLPIIGSILLADSWGNKRGLTIVKVQSTFYTRYLAILGIVIGLLSVIASAFNIFSIEVQFRDYAYDIFVLLSGSSRVLLLLLILCLPLKVLLNELVPRGLKLRPENLDSIAVIKHSIKKKTKIMYLGLFIALLAILVIIPHLETVNPDGRDVGVDTHWYVDWTNDLAQSNNLQDFFGKLFTIQNGDRPFSLLLLYLIVGIVNVDSTLTYEIIVPIIFGGALVLVTYIFAREITQQNEKIALFAAFLTVVSFQTLIGIFAGFYANWLAIIIGYLSFFFLFRYLKSPSRLYLILYSISLVILLFSHVYTWTILAVITVVFLLVVLKLNYYKKRNIILVLSILLSSLAVDVAKSAITDATLGIGQDIHVASIMGGSLLENLSLRWDNITLVQAKYAAQFGNFIMLMLGVYWIYIANWRRSHAIFLFIFMSIGIFPLFFGNWIIQSRVLYDIPFQIPAAISLSYIINRPNGTLVLLPICIWLVAMAVRAVSNYYLILPS